MINFEKNLLDTSQNIVVDTVVTGIKGIRDYDAECAYLVINLNKTSFNKIASNYSDEYLYMQSGDQKEVDLSPSKKESWKSIIGKGLVVYKAKSIGGILLDANTFKVSASNCIAVASKENITDMEHYEGPMFIEVAGGSLVFFSREYAKEQPVDIELDNDVVSIRSDKVIAYEKALNKRYDRGFLKFTGTGKIICRK